MELAEVSHPDDVPDSIEPLKKEEDLPEIIKKAFTESKTVGTQMSEEERFAFTEATLTQLMTLYGMDDETAVKIKELIDSGEVKSMDALGKCDFVTDQQMQLWSESFK